MENFFAQVSTQVSAEQRAAERGAGPRDDGRIALPQFETLCDALHEATKAPTLLRDVKRARAPHRSGDSWWALPCVETCARKISLYDPTFSRTVWGLYGGAKGLAVWYYQVGALLPQPRRRGARAAAGAVPVRLPSAPAPGGAVTRP